LGDQLSIKSEDACRLASELAEVTGESITTAVTEALRERLARQMQLRKTSELKARLLALTDEIRAHMQEPVSSDHCWLYDEHGFPR
jgi:antitoxin VapB